MRKGKREPLRSGALRQPDLTRIKPPSGLSA
jgi:hypothetical protein